MEREKYNSKTMDCVVDAAYFCVLYGGVVMGFVPLPILRLLWQVNE